MSSFPAVWPAPRLTLSSSGSFTRRASRCGRGVAGSERPPDQRPRSPSNLACGPVSQVGDRITGGDIYGIVAENSLIEHRLMLPAGARGTVSYIAPSGHYNVEEEIIEVDFQGQKKVRTRDTLLLGFATGEGLHSERAVWQLPAASPHLWPPATFAKAVSARSFHTLPVPMSIQQVTSNDQTGSNRPPHYGFPAFRCVLAHTGPQRLLPPPPSSSHAPRRNTA